MPDQPPPLDFGDDDGLFAVPPATKPRGPHTGRDHPDTSRRAAAKVTPAVGTLRRQVEAFGHRVGEAGFIDDELVEAVAENGQQGNRSVIPRRIELVDANILLDSGRKRNNARGNPCVVWVHRDFVLQPPLVRDPAQRVKPAEVEAAFQVVDKWARQMKNEGRLFVSELLDAIAVLKAR